MVYITTTEQQWNNATKKQRETVLGKINLWSGWAKHDFDMLPKWVRDDIYALVAGKIKPRKRKKKGKKRVEISIQRRKR